MTLPSGSTLREYGAAWGVAAWANLEGAERAVGSAVNDAWIAATNWRQPRDPLAIDLDGDGIETLGIPTDGSTPALFDHNADGIRTGTGWLTGDDAWLVLDRDANGSIDSGRELFGVDTRITVTETVNGTPYTYERNARTGFEALRTLDANADHQFDAQDAAFTQVRLWQDANGDGISQTTELSSLADKAIVRIALTETTTTTNLGNGNSITGTATVTRANGSSTQIDSVDLTAGNLNLAENGFYREFTDTIPWTTTASALPEMRGSGWLRDLREAMSLGTAQATQLQQVAAQFAASTTRSQQLAAMGSVLSQWAGTTGRVDTSYMRPVSRTVLSETATAQTVRYTAMDPANYPDPMATLVPLAKLLLPATYYETVVLQPSGQSAQMLTTAGLEVMRRLGELEAFNGSRFINFTAIESIGGGGGGQGTGGGGGAGVVGQTTGYQTRWQINLAADQVANINASYDALTESVYAALVVQTRLRPYLDSIELVIDAAGIRFETTALTAMLDAAKASDESRAVIDLVELVRYSYSTLQAVGLDGIVKLRGWVDALPADSPLRAELTATDVLTGAVTQGSARSDIYFGNASSASFWGAAGNDVIDGGAGNDTLEGGTGNDIFEGGMGNDLLIGGNDLDLNAWNGSNYYTGHGNDTYRFGRGDGQDTLWDVDASTGNLDTISLKAGVAPGEVRISRPANTNHLVLSILGTTDSITVMGFFTGDGAGGWAIEQISFADGTTWDLATIKAQALLGSTGADDLAGYASGDSIDAGGGNDRVWGRAGNDTLLGGAGDDLLKGEDGNDSLQGQDGGDTLFGGAGNDLLEGGAGNDLLVGGHEYEGFAWNGSNYYSGQGNDTYRFGRGDGQDTVWDVDTSAGNADTLSLKAGVAPGEVRISRAASSNNLVLSILGTTDSVTIREFFNGDGAGGFAVERISFADGTTWDLATIKAMLLAPTSGADDLTGYAGDDVIEGGEGNDRVWARAGNDAVLGGAGNDELNGEDGNDVIDGGDGADQVYGNVGADVLTGGAGDDALYGDFYYGQHGGNDTLDGGAGNDLLVGGFGSDTYLFGRGDGQDTLRNQSDGWNGYADPTVGKLDTLQLKAGVAVSDVTLVRSGDNLIVKINGTTDQVTVLNYFISDGVSTQAYAVEQIRFDDGTSWDIATVKSLVMQGGSGDDNLLGYASADVMSGAAGNDTIDGRSGDDTIDGGDGADQLYGSDGADVLRGGAGDDGLFGGGYYGGVGGNDTLDGGAGNDLLVGGFGSDTYLFGRGDGQDTLKNRSDGWDGYADPTVGKLDTLQFKAGVAVSDVTLVRSGDNLIVKINGTTDQVTMVSYFIGDGVSTQGYAVEQIRFDDGTTWNLATIKAQALLGSTGADDITGYASGDSIDAGAGNDRVWGRAGNDTLLGGAGDDLLKGEDDNDSLQGQDGGDTLFGGAGNDLLEGGVGNDLLVGGHEYEGFAWNGSNYFSGQGNDTYRFGRGDGQDTLWDVDASTGNLDTISLKAGVAPGEVRISRPANTNHLVLSILGTTDSVTVMGFFTGDGAGGWAIEQISFADGTTWDLATIKAQSLVGTTANDVITGFAGNDVLIGNAGNDTLGGLAGNDILDGGSGSDTLTGGVGNDTYRVDSASDVLIELAGEGIDTVETGLTWTLASNFENLILTGASALNATGNAAANVLTGNSGANRLDGGAGADTLIGAGGNDVYVIDDSGDVVVEVAGEGSDSAESSVNWVMGAELESLTLLGSADIGATGNAIANTLVGNAGANRLDGGQGADTMTGGAGNDVYVVDAAGDVTNEAASGGTDTVEASVSWALGLDLENLILTGVADINATGNAGANTLYGNGGNNVLDGLAGADQMFGGAGNDTYVVESTTDVVTEYANEGIDTVQTNLAFTLGADVENLTLTGSSAVSAAGNALDNVLTGNAASNTLTGGAGNDTLDGGLGTDTLVGGLGNDIYVVNVGTDVTTENANEGIDTVRSDVTRTLAANFENLTLTGSGVTNGTGNTLDNVLTGNAANNTLTGDAGNDTLDGGLGVDSLVGGAGDDIYFVDVATDVVTEKANGGMDTVHSAATWTLANNLENLTLTGVLAINGTGNGADNLLTGNSANNTLTGGAGNDRLDGGAGIDTLVGGAGNDIYVVDVAADVVTEAANAGTDTVLSGVTLTLTSANLEHLTLTGTSAINGTGNALANALTGNTADNVLTGAAGNDTLDGGAGADTLAGGVGNDTYVLGRGYGAELLQENDATAGNTDVVQFLAGISSEQIWLRQVGTDLQVSIIGSSDQVLLANWYLGSQYHAEQFKTSDGKTLLDSKVQSLVDAMAAFAPPGAGQTTLPSDYQASLAPVIAASWG